MVVNWLCHIPTLHHYGRFPPGGNMTGGNIMGNHHHHHTVIRDNLFDPSQFYRVHIWCSPIKGESINAAFSMPVLLIRQPVCDERPHFPMIEHRYKLSLAFSFVSFSSIENKPGA